MENFLPFSTSDGRETTNLVTVTGISWYADGTAALFGTGDWVMELTREDADRLREGYSGYMPPHKPADDPPPPDLDLAPAPQSNDYTFGFALGLCVGLLLGVIAAAFLTHYQRTHDTPTAYHTISADDYAQLITTLDECIAGPIHRPPAASGDSQQEK